MKLSRRGWNNVLILAILAFIAIINAPSVLREHFGLGQTSALPYVLDPNEKPVALHFAQWSVENTNNEWQSTRQLSVEPLQAALRWTELTGTSVDQATYNKLKDNLPPARTLEVWYSNVEEPARITFYQTPSFWLLQNWEKEWVAVSVDKQYLFPFL
ncbi:hypothetical protein TUMSATVNIG1_34650 [Vibrio nigripulchritudo]|uniref:hypothetical protein n=1 Tax=Vibrio nigripulchritudo TaxID=28173 RepID=UPI00190E3647|nr:hypothetical protein [Vibrio nigripulchritudo]BCL71499.1 hypothetical protein VNTUMSATTG_34360 [Vibrio nigripulchritudo]BDU32856.1 hypothetical protein TUMSATVNIG1_34650 [Vibrio nigripulchritudo]